MSNFRSKEDTKTIEGRTKNCLLKLRIVCNIGETVNTVLLVMLDSPNFVQLCSFIPCMVVEVIEINSLL